MELRIVIYERWDEKTEIECAPKKTYKNVNVINNILLKITNKALW